MAQLWDALHYGHSNLEGLKSLLRKDIAQWNAQARFDERQSVIQLPMLLNPLLSTPSESNYSELVDSGDLVEETVSRDFER